MRAIILSLNHNFLIKKDFFRFLLIGVFSTLINYFVFYGLYGLIGLNYLFSSMVGFIVGVFVGYRFNQAWTFERTDCFRYELYRYLFVYLFSLLLAIFLLKILVERFNFLPEIVNFFMIFLTACTNFLGVKYWAFKV
jgi:putative flippase GtrA